MEFSAKQIAEFIHGKIEGDENATVNTFAKIEEGKKGAISFLSNPKYTHYSASLLSTQFITNFTSSIPCPLFFLLLILKESPDIIILFVNHYL